MSILIFILVAWTLIAAGRTVASRLTIPDTASILDKNLIGYGIGLVFFAYLILVVGLIGWLERTPLDLVVAGLFVLGLRQSVEMLREAGRVLLTCFHPARPVWLFICVLTAFNAMSLIGCFTPPIKGMAVPGLQGPYTEWDSLSYHLADPKIYIHLGRIAPIWWEHHSNFAFTGEMWYAFGLLHGSILLAKLFHWSCGLAASLTVYRIGLRFLGLRAAAIAGIIFASTPVVFWEAGTAYVDLIATYFGGLALMTLSAGIAQKNEKWLRLSGFCMGLMLAGKATAVTTLALFAIALLVWRLRVQRQSTADAIRMIAAWCAAAIVVGCPWYVKATAYTGNPIYPFYYKIFGGKYWSTANAQSYDLSNAAFGFGHKPINLVLAPYDLTMYPMPGSRMYTGDGRQGPFYRFLASGNIGLQPFNNTPSELVTFPCILLACLFVPALLSAPKRKRQPDPEPSNGTVEPGPQSRSNDPAYTAPEFIPGSVAPNEAAEQGMVPYGVFEGKAASFVKWLSLYGLISFVLWFYSMQYVRYLLPILPAYCLIAAWVIDRALAVGAIAGRALVALTIGSVALSGYVGIALAEAQLPVVTGQISVDEYVLHGFAPYAAMQYINSRLPVGSKIVFYNAPYGFYCDKPYMWGEAGHSTFIPYEKMHSAQDLLRWFQGNGVTHVLINIDENYTPAPGPDYNGWVYQLTYGSSQPVYDDGRYPHHVVVFALPETYHG